MKRKKSKKILLLSLLLFFSCKYNNDIYFDIDKQQLNSCNGVLRNIVISSSDDGISLFWNDTMRTAPKTLNIDSIPVGFKITSKGLLRKNKFQMIPNTKYTIEKWGSGVESFTIDIWTDSKGKVLKTSNSKCGIESQE